MDDVDDGRGARPTARVAGVLCTLSSLGAVLVGRLLDLTPLDIASYAVLAPIVVLGLVGAAPWAWRGARRAAKPRPPAVLPDRYPR